jgi:3-hydroxybutyryl-CoA dehydrogenase
MTSNNTTLPAMGVVGLGTMGFSIAACFLTRRHPTVAIATNEQESTFTLPRMHEYLEKLGCAENIDLLTVSDDYAALADCEIVTESVVENANIKREVIAKIENAVDENTLIASNTSALPITELQQDARHPERVLGMHWALPAPQSKLLEVICGNQTAPQSAQRAIEWAKSWDKETALVRKDVPGFVGNRIMYAMIREACHLVENGVATPADVDAILRHDIGAWIGFAGLFQYMDLTGGKLYATVMESLLPHLCNSRELPEVMKKLQEENAGGTANGHGFYDYTPEEAKNLDAKFLEYSVEVGKLTQKYFLED